VQSTQNYGAFCNQQKAKTSFVFRLLVFVAASAFFAAPFRFPFPPFWTAIVCVCVSAVPVPVRVYVKESVSNEPFQFSMLTHLHLLIKKFRVRPRDRHQLAERKGG